MSASWSLPALLFAFGALQATMLALAMLSQGALKRANLALAGLMLALAATLLVPLLQEIGSAPQWPRLLIVLSGLPYLFGPLLLLHVAALTGQPRMVRAWTWSLHLALPLAYAALAVWLWRHTDAELAGLLAPPPVPARIGVLPLSKQLSLLVYTALSMSLLWAHERALRANLAETTAFELRGLRLLVGASALLVLAMTAHALFGFAGTRLDAWLAGAVSALIVLAGFHGLRQPSLPPELEADSGVSEPGPPATTALSPPADTSGADAGAPAGASKPVADAELPALAARVLATAREPAQLFDHGLNLARLAKACRLTQNQLSHVLNHGIGEGFYDLVNRLRVEAVQERLRDPAAKARPILDLAFECGFSTKTTFNKAFRAVTGQTPSAWRDGRGASGPGAPAGG
jgi:AraC-like DNA-binding protein